MKEIICPNCKTPFTIDESGYADIAKQIKDHLFEEEIQKRLSIAEREKESAVKLAEATIKNSLQDTIQKKENEIILDIKGVTYNKVNMFTTSEVKLSIDRIMKTYESFINRL